MKAFKWDEGRVTTSSPPKPKKITGTHFPSVLGLNPYSTPFEVWCRCVRLYEIPFEGNKYTEAGQVIEPKVFDFLRNSMGFGDRVITPSMVYGENPFGKTYGDFYPEQSIFGGMWDAMILDPSGSDVESIVEIKTVKVDGHSGTLEERWQGGQAPHYQALQASLYAYLKGIENVIMVAVALSESKGDYEHPETVIPSFANSNVYIDQFNVHERYPDFDNYIDYARTWWNNHVIIGESPEYDEKKDAEILKELRTNHAPVSDSISETIKEAESLKEKLDSIARDSATIAKRLKELQEVIKTHAQAQFRDGDNKIDIAGDKYLWTVSRTASEKFDSAAFKEANPDEYRKYISITNTDRLTVTERK